MDFPGLPRAWKIQEKIQDFTELSRMRVNPGHKGNKKERQQT